MKRAKRENAFWLYTGGFLLAALVLAFVLGLHKKLPILTMDGYWQHYTVLGYIQQAVRSLLRSRKNGGCCGSCSHNCRHRA